MTGRHTISPAHAPDGVAATLRALSAGEATVESVTTRCLERVEAGEAAIRAWVHLDPELAVTRARELDGVPASMRRALHGVPVGVKDIFDTHDMPTAYGSPIYEGHRPPADAASVAIARQRGMVVLGKLVTTEFAAWPPGPTTNPHDPTRTPGGSSSGSAAAVAAGMVPVAFATQTTGSIVRPAAFCGVVGYKPTHGTLPCVGVKAISETFDTVGVITRTVEDAALVVGSLSGRGHGRPGAPTRGAGRRPARGRRPHARVRGVGRGRGRVASHRRLTTRDTVSGDASGRSNSTMFSSSEENAAPASL